MIEIGAERGKGWTNSKNNNNHVPSHIDVGCQECGRSLANVKLTWSFLHFGHALHVCVWCKAHTYFVLANAPKSDKREDRKATKLFVYPAPGVRTDIEERVRKVSPRFERIYRQALTAEQTGLDEIAGMGHRKALEFLLKDYAKHRHSGEADVIESKPLWKVIKDYLTAHTPNLAVVANRAAWLGNDEAHYIRIWKDRDLKDLKDLIGVVLSEINTQLMIEELPEEMPASGPRDD